MIVPPVTTAGYNICSRPPPPCTLIVVVMEVQDRTQPPLPISVWRITPDGGFGEPSEKRVFRSYPFLNELPTHALPCGKSGCYCGP